jgi:DNA-binding GntR family transcriptional regulator
MDKEGQTSAAVEENESPNDSPRVAEVVEWVARGIIEGRLQPGDDLNSVDLAKRFSLSRTPVREALFVLSREGLVDWSPRRRPRVSTLDIKNVRELYQLRAMLYAQVSHAIVEHATADDIAALWRAHGKLAEVAARGDVDGYFWANVAFRDEELRVSRNGIFKEVLDTLRLRTNRLRHLSTSLCEAYEERDGTLAAALNRSIVLGALHAIEQAWQHEPGKF